MTTKKLSDLDFMMMDVHRPLLNAEIEEINPQARLDKSLRLVEDEHSEEESVGAPHPQTKCDICFGAMPCEQHPNVEHLRTVTSLDISATAILARAHDAGLTEVVVVGIRGNGREYFAANISDAAATMYHLQRGIHKLNQVVDGDYEDDNIGPPSTA